MLTTHKIQNDAPVALGIPLNKGQGLPGKSGFSEALSNEMGSLNATSKMFQEGGVPQGISNAIQKMVAQDKEGANGLLTLSELADGQLPTAAFSGLLSAEDVESSIINQTAIDPELLASIDADTDGLSGIASSVEEFVHAQIAQPASKVVSEEGLMKSALSLDAGSQDSIIDNQAMNPQAILASDTVVDTELTAVEVDSSFVTSEIVDEAALAAIDGNEIELVDTGLTQSVVGAQASALQADDATINSNAAAAASNESPNANEVNEQALNATVANPANTAAASQTAQGLDKPVSGNAANATPPASANAQQTTWGTQATDSSQAASNASNGNSSQSGQQQSQNSQQQQSQMAQQQMMQQQDQKAQALNQQAALKLSDEQAAKAESKEGILTSDVGAAGDRRSALPIGLQTINVPVKSPQWGQAVAHRVVFMANNQIQQAHITLNPEKLGPIQIKLQIDREQQVQVSMMATHGTTREALEAAMPRLKEMLEQSGMNLVSVDISDEKQFAQQDSEQNGSKLAGGNNNSNVESSEEESSPVQTVVSDNLVDYYA